MTGKIFSIAAVLSLFIFALIGFDNLSARSFEKAPVITYMRKGSNEAPYITGVHVCENGRVRLIDNANGTGRRYIFISRGRVQRLLNMIVKEQNFFSISQAYITTFQNSREQMLDAATTYITVRSRYGYHKLSIYDVFRNTNVSSNKMVRLRSIVQTLEKLLQETKKKLR